MADQPTFVAASFFEVLLPAMLRDKGAAALAVDGAIELVLVEGEAHRCWFVERGEVVEATHPDPDVSITIDETLVTPLLLGTIDVEAAIEEGSLEVHGDPDVLERWGRLFGSELSGMKTLFAAAGVGRGEDR